MITWIKSFFKSEVNHKDEYMHHCIMALHHFERSEDESRFIKIEDTDLCLAISKNPKLLKITCEKQDKL